MRQIFSTRRILPHKLRSTPQALASSQLNIAVLVTIGLCLIMISYTHAAGERRGIRDPHLRMLYLSLRTPVLADSSWMVEDTLRLSFPDFRLALHRGALTALCDSTKHITGFLFEGMASVDFHPASALERFQLARFTRDSVLSCEVSRLVIRLADVRAWARAAPEEWEMFSMLYTGPRHIKGRSRREAEELQRLVEEGLRKRHNMNVAARLLTRRLSDAAGAFALCAFYPENTRDFSPPLHIYVYDAQARETVALYSYFPRRIGRQFFTLCSYAPGGSAHLPSNVRLTKYNGWIALDEKGNLEADLGLDIFTGSARPAVLNFALSADLIVTRVLAESGDTLDFAQEHEEAGVTVFLPERDWQEDTLRLLFHYEGEALRRHPNNTFFLKDPIHWSPRLGYLERAQYQIIFKCPPRQRVLAVGELVRDWEESGFHLSFFKTLAPAKAATFCMGNFRSDTLLAARPDLPAIVIHTTPLRSAQERRRVAGDLANSLFFFGQFLGAYSQPCLRVVEAPTVHSQGFPGFVTLSWLGFSSTWAGAREALRGHEVAHQWFGNLMGWRTYHDQWLSEGFAEYLGAMYVQWLALAPGQFERIVKAWRDDVLEGGHIGASLGMKEFGLGKAALRNAEGPRAGPIWMGARLGQNEVLDYYSQTYEKGAYVVHMLRWLMRDLETGSDARFWSMLADFVMSYRNAEPESGDFQRLAEKHYGAPLDWFFHQWIFTNQIPTYSWYYSLERLPGADPALPVARIAAAAKPLPEEALTLLRVHVRQEGVPRDFRMFVPVTVEHDDSTTTTARVLVSDEGGELAVPLPAGKFKRIVFNSGEAVLCRVKNENGERLRTGKSNVAR